MDYMDLVQVYSVIVRRVDYFFISFSHFFFLIYLITNKQSHVDRNADITVSCAAVGDRCVKSPFICVSFSFFWHVCLFDVTLLLGEYELLAVLLNFTLDPCLFN